MIDAADRAMLDRVAAGGERIVAGAVEWCGIPSGSFDADGLARMADVLAAAFAGLGARMERVALGERVEVDAAGHERRVAGGEALHLSMRPDVSPRVLLTGHFDTVYSADSPFREVRRREDGALNGPGIADMKGGLSVMLAALEVWEARADATAIGWDVLLSPDEEIGSPGSAPHLARLAKGAVLGMTYEPALADGTLVSARMGSGNYAAVLRGRAVHVGRDFAEGRNAVVAAARVALELDTLNGARAGVRVNVARVDGGAPLNTVPDVAVLRFNVRVETPDDARWIEAAIAGLLARSPGEGLSATLHGGMTRLPKPFTPAQQALFEGVREVGATLGQPLAWRPSGGVCEGNNLFAAGLASIDTLGVRGGDIHSDREFAWPESFVERAQLSALMLARVADGSIDPARC